MKKLYIVGILSLIILLPVAIIPQNPSSAQTDYSMSCSAFTQQAIQHVRQSCSDLERGSACYGNHLVDALPRPNRNNFSFEVPGDISDISNIAYMQLSGLENSGDQWGIVRMELLASIPRASSEAVSIVLFGSVLLENAGADHEPTLVTVDNENGIALRTEATYSSEVIKKASIRDRLWAYERSEDGEWLHVEVPATGELVWINTADVISDHDLTSLPISNGQPYYHPMQAVYLRNSGNSMDCNDFPVDGMLIQTPEGVGKVTMLVNEVVIELGSTAFVDVRSPGLMTISLLEGHSFVTSKGVRQELPAGFSTSILLDQDMRANSIPSVAVSMNPSLANLLTIGPGSVWMEEAVVQTYQAEQSAPPPNNNAEPEPQKTTKKKKKTAKKTTTKSTK